MQFRDLKAQYMLSLIHIWEIRLSGKEFSLLRYMAQNAGTVLSREKLEQHIWNYDFTGGSNVIDVYIRYLRKKIDEGQEHKLIHTVRGAGYVPVSDTHLDVYKRQTQKSGQAGRKSSSYYGRCAAGDRGCRLWRLYDPAQYRKK